MSTIELKTVGEILNKEFIIPTYQRGYRWTQQNINDLLNDIKEHYDNRKENPYCMQPIVVKKCEKINDAEKLKQIKRSNSIEDIEKILNDKTLRIIDGQQRLTSVFILLKYLGVETSKLYCISYESRKESKAFLENVESEVKSDLADNIDFDYMMKSYEAVRNWFEDERNKECQKQEILNHILNKVCFIWYEIGENEDENKVFVRLNKGKIPLTDSELIKALILNESNFNCSKEISRKIQVEIANEWDKIENTLQENDFWGFLNNKTYNNATRIDFIFDKLKEGNELKLTDEQLDQLEEGNNKSFRYFYEYSKSKDKDPEWSKTLWAKVKNKFNILNEWYNSSEIYHYAGFLLHSNIELSELLNLWEGSKKKFIDDLKGKIRDLLKKNNPHYNDLEYSYDEPGKTKCKPLLLLFNLQSIINRNLKFKERTKYQQGVFYKFPFALYQKENWDIEHIASNTDNPLDSKKDLQQFLGDLRIAEKINEEDYNKYMQELDTNDTEEERNNIRNKIKEKMSNPTNTKDQNRLDEKSKNQICNYTLLDESTNREYKNSLFSVKREHIISKDSGKRIILDKSKKNNEIEITFVPPCTKNVFLKYYTKNTNDLSEWTKMDAENYRAEIKETLKEFLDR